MIESIIQIGIRVIPVNEETNGEKKAKKKKKKKKRKKGKPADSFNTNCIFINDQNFFQGKWGWVGHNMQRKSAKL